MRGKITTVLALLLVLCLVPVNTAFGNTYDYSYSLGSEEEPAEPYDNEKAVIDEAKELGVPNAFYRHYFAEEFNEGNLEEPVTELVEGEEEQPEIDIHTVTTSADREGLEIKKIDTGVLARTKIDLGVFNFDDLKVSRLVYNMLAKKTLKGSAYLFFGDSDEAFAQIKIKRCATDDWEETKNKTIDLRKANLSGEDHIYLKFIADSALDEDNNIIPTTGVKGNIYFESMFFTEGSTPVIQFDLDDEVNTIENVNGSELHSIMACGDMNIQFPQGYKSEWSDKTQTDATYALDYIRGRGNSTWLVDKKPYKLKLEESTDLFGMGKNKHWVLLANYYDYSLIRNRLTFDIGRNMNLAFTPKSVCVDVVISGEYYGSYQLSQHVRVGKNNVNIKDLEDNPETEEPGITGGYLLSMGGSWLTEDEGTALEGAGGKFYLERPEYDKDYPEDARTAQLNYLNNYLDELDTLVNNLADDDPDNDTIDGKTWRDYMDEDSFIDYYFMQEFSQNGDAFDSGSTYLYKDRNGKLFWGPLWDFDFVAWAAYETNNNSGIDFTHTGSCPWLSTLLEKDETFKQKLIDRWAEISEMMSDATKEGGLIDKYYEETYYSALANYQCRSTYLADGEGYWGGSIDLVDDEGEPYVLNYSNEMARLKKYINARKAWLDENIESIGEGGSYSDDYPPVNFMVDDEVYATVHADVDNWTLKQDEIPDDPIKEGFKFKGWYYKEYEDGVEIESKFNKHMWPYEYDDESEEYVPYTIYAKFVPGGEVVGVDSLEFVRDQIYVPLEVYDDDDYQYVSEEMLNIQGLLNVKPMDADLDDLEFFIDGDYDADEDEQPPIYIDGNGEIYVTQLGEYTVGCRLGDLEARIKVIAIDGETQTVPDNYSIESSVTLKTGEYGDVGFKFDDEEKIDYACFNNVDFASLDESVVKVNGNGMFYAVGEGETEVITIFRRADDIVVKATKITVGGDGKKTDPKKQDKKDSKASDKNKVGAIITDGTYNYKITKTGSKNPKKSGNVTVIGLRNKKVKNIKIANTITYNGVKYIVNKIAPKAFAKNKKIKAATIGANVKYIGAKAFFGTKKLKKLTVKSKKLKKIGKKAFYRKKGKKLKIKVKKSKKKAYKKLFKKAKTNKFKF